MDSQVCIWGDISMGKLRCEPDGEEMARSTTQGGSGPDYTDPQYWNGLIKMSMSKFFVLCVLTQKAMHGYEIAKQVDVSTAGCCSPSPGALYPVLKEFEEGGYVTGRSEVHNGRERRVYEITPKGREAFRVATEAWTGITQCITTSCGTSRNNAQACGA